MLHLSPTYYQTMFSLHHLVWRGDVERVISLSFRDGDILSFSATTLKIQKCSNFSLSLSFPPTRCYVCGDTLAEVSPSVRNNQTKWELMYSLHSDDPRKLLNSRCSTKFNMKKKREALPEREPSHIRRGEVEGF